MTVFRIVATYLILCKMRASWRKTGNTCSTEISGQTAAAICENSTRCKPRDAFEGGAHKPVPRSVKRQFIKPTRNFTSIEQSLRGSHEYIDTSSNPSKHVLTVQISSRKIPPHSSFDFSD